MTAGTLTTGTTEPRLIMKLLADGTAQATLAWYWGDEREQAQRVFAEARRWCLDQFGPEVDGRYRVWFPMHFNMPEIHFHDLTLATAFRVRWC